MVLIGTAALAIMSNQARAEFPDVPMDHWAYDAVTYLEGEGFIIGYPDGTYQGDRQLTRYEFAIVVSRLYDQFLDLLEEGMGPEIDVDAILDMLMEEFQPEIDELRELIAGNTERIETLEGTVGGFDGRIVGVEDLVAAMDRRFHPYGDISLRFYGIYPDDGMQSQRPMLQLRWGFKTQINDELTLGTRFTTGALGGRQSGWTSLQDRFGFDQLNVDLAYLQWRPESYPGFTMWGGKFAPMWRTTPMVFDSDLTFEGLAQHYNWGNFNFYLGELFPVEKGFYLIAQAGYNNLFADNFNVAVTYHYINDEAFGFIMNDMMTGALPSNWDFTRLDSPDDYRAFEIYGEWSHELGNIPFKIQADYLMNLESTAPGLLDEAGWQQAAWARLTLLDKPAVVGDWNVYGEWGRIQPNSVFTWMTDAARGKGDHEFWVVGWNYRLMQNTDFYAIYYNRERLSDPTDTSEVVQIQITSRFN